MRYEILYLIGGAKEAELEKIKGEVKEIISSLGGVFEEKETLEKRKMAYEIKKEVHGIYIAQRFELPEIENIKEVSRKMNLNNDLLRFIISRADELPELKSKEERIREAEGKASAPAEKTETKKESVSKKEITEPIKKEEEVPAKEDDDKKITRLENIDDKLEEILNI